MSNPLNDLDWGSWLYGLLWGAIGGGSSAVVSGITVALNDPKDYGIGSGKFMGLVCTVFLANAAMSMFLFLKQSPLPPVKTVTTVETVNQKTPTTTVTTKVEQTKVEPVDAQKGGPGEAGKQ
jgi:hypothetical protein